MKIALGPSPFCDSQCGDFAAEVYETFKTGRYDFPASILRLEDIDVWLRQHRTARRRAARAWSLGYRTQWISRADHVDEIHAINTSLAERQGRPMADSYLERPTHTKLPDYSCPRHRIDEWGCFAPGGTLIAYIVVYVCGELALISQILGHGDHLANDVMYLLVRDALNDMLLDAGPASVFYNRHDSGTDGLRYFKERLGFQPTKVEWAL